MKPLPLIGAGLLLAGVIAGQRRVSRAVQALMLLAALATGAIGTGLVEPPNLEHAVRQLRLHPRPVHIRARRRDGIPRDRRRHRPRGPRRDHRDPRRRRRRPGRDRARAADRARLGLRGRRRHPLVRPRPPARAGVPAGPRPPGQTHARSGSRRSSATSRSTVARRSCSAGSSAPFAR